MVNAAHCSYLSCRRRVGIVVVVVRVAPDTDLAGYSANIFEGYLAK